MVNYELLIAYTNGNKTKAIDSFNDRSAIGKIHFMQYILESFDVSGNEKLLAFLKSYFMIREESIDAMRNNEEI